MLCGRCGKPLSNPKSIERGYGPVCWKKMNENNLDNPYDKGETEDNDYPSIKKYIRNIVVIGEPKCFICGASLLAYGNIEHYKHQGGYPLKGFKDPQWIFYECEKCGYQYSFKKLLNRRVPKNPSVI